MSSSHYTKNGRNVMLKTISSQMASSPDFNASEAYRSLRDRGPYPATQVVRDFQGKFAFIPLDSGSKTDADGCVSFFWGADTDENLVLADEKEVVTKSCETFSVPFSKGLSNFEHPLNEVKSVPRVDSSELDHIIVKPIPNLAKDGLGAAFPFFYTEPNVILHSHNE
ncbi:hypothetical protein Ahy_A04g017822 [Arachis hypogaea]|uniref:DUF3700 domain-containing protein n=1 Tax=Arachis hypogaea TaxID=3818 RepID=A0A445DC49_ARAHY|nr:hypothetical protein Ahy_A04g017822 [Arachis hypogaea]